MSDNVASPINSGLVVDSSFSSRKELVSDLRQDGLVLDVIEAQSVTNALEILISRVLDLCVLGPTLSETSAIDLITRGKRVAPKNCAFVAVVNENCSRVESLFRAGADSIIELPYTKETFSSSVADAVQIAQVSGSTASGQEDDSPQAVLKSLTTDSLPVSLIRTARRLKRIASDITNDKLHLSQNGNPSISAKNALRDVLETALCIETADARLPGTFEHFFIRSLVEWFTERVHHSERVCNERLRRKLLGHH